MPGVRRDDVRRGADGSVLGVVWAMRTAEEIAQAVDDARALRHPWRAMRVALECGLLRLLPWHSTVMGVGAYTGCRICPSADGGWVERLVVNVEETGVLHEPWATEADQQ